MCYDKCIHKKGDVFMNLIKVGDPAPDFSLKDNREQIIRLSDYKGKKVFLEETL